MVPEKGMRFKHYTYKVTFPGMPWYYWGVHTDNGKPYFGSPKTHKWIWEFYEFEIQILEWFETRQEAEAVEDRLIKHTINDPNCLNEHWGGGFSIESCKKGGRSCASSEERSRRAKKLHEVKNEEGKSELAVYLGRTYLTPHAKQASVIPHRNKDEQGRSIHTLNSLHKNKTSEGKSVVGVQQALRNNKKEWIDPDHPELGVRSIPTLVRMQNYRGYPSGPENRRRVYPSDQ